MTPDDLMRSICYPSTHHGRENAAFCIESPQTQSPTYRLRGNGPVPPRSTAKSGAIAPESGAFASRASFIARISWYPSKVSPIRAQRSGGNS